MQHISKELVILYRYILGTLQILIDFYYIRAPKDSRWRKLWKNTEIVNFRMLNIKDYCHEIDVFGRKCKNTLCWITLWWNFTQTTWFSGWNMHNKYKNITSLQRVGKVMTSVFSVTLITRFWTFASVALIAELQQNSFWAHLIMSCSFCSLSFSFNSKKTDSRSAMTTS